MKLSWGPNSCPMPVVGSKFQDTSWRELSIETAALSSESSVQYSTEVQFSLGEPVTTLNAGWEYVLCFCPDYPGISAGICGKTMYYIQTVGKVNVLMLQFGVVREATGYSQRVGIHAVTSFSARVDCGGETCGTAGRIKFVSQVADNALNHWESAGKGCNTANETELRHQPPNCGTLASTI